MVLCAQRSFADAQDDSEAVSLTCYSKCEPCHVERSETSFTPFLPLSFRPSGASGEICMLVMRGTVVGIYSLRRLQLRRCGELDPEGLSSRLAVAFHEMLYFMDT